MAAYQHGGGLPRYRSNSNDNRSSIEKMVDRANAEGPDQYTMENEEYDEPTLTRPTLLFQSANPRPHGRPLIEYVRNEWRTNPKYGQVYSNFEEDDRPPKMLKAFTSVLGARKVRRYILVYLVLLCICYGSWRGFLGPHWNEQNVLAQSLNSKMRSGKGWFGANARPEFTDMIHLKTLDSRLIPNDKKHGKGVGKRLVFVGDVHGCKKELVELLDKISFHPNSDHLILAGDMIAKGPDSLGVLDLARGLGASCVRGNHEDRILLIHNDLKSALIPLKGPRESVDHPEKDMLDEESFSRGDYESRALAKSLSHKHVEFLQSCPVILRVGEIVGWGDIVTVHAGLVPGVDLEKQDPASVMKMRTIDLETHVPSKDPKGGMHWTKLWNKHQSLLPKDALHTTVIYGHDSKRGLQLARYTKGLDTGCNKGGKLTALIIRDGGKSKTMSVRCKDHRGKKPLKANVADVLEEGKVKKDKGGDDDDEESQR